MQVLRLHRPRSGVEGVFVKETVTSLVSEEPTHGEVEAPHGRFQGILQVEITRLIFIRVVLPTTDGRPRGGNVCTNQIDLGVIRCLTEGFREHGRPFQFQRIVG